MWPDNETEVDLLGFDFLVDALVVALTEPRLLPVRVALLGDWGSGKSSLMKIARGELLQLDGEASSHYLCVEFSPWQYEDYEDVKTALMNAALDEIGRHVDASQQERISRLRRFVVTLRRLGRGSARVAVSAGAAVAPLAAKAMDPRLDPAAFAAVQAASAAIAGEVTQHLEDPAEPEAAAEETIIDAGRFRREFSTLLAEVEQVKAVVVFVDDHDRCLPETVVDTFEAIRLFLNTPKTAEALVGVIRSGDLSGEQLSCVVLSPSMGKSSTDGRVQTISAQRLNDALTASVSARCGLWPASQRGEHRGGERRGAWGSGEQGAVRFSALLLPSGCGERVGGAQRRAGGVANYCQPR